MPDLEDALTPERVGVAFEAEQADPRQARNPGDIPVSYEQIDCQWFTDIVCKGDPEARVIAYRPELPDDLDRGHMRVWLTYNDAGVAAGRPASVFCKDSQKLHVRRLSALTGAGPSEVNFYNKLLPVLGVEAPKSLFAAYDPRTFNSIVVFEDLVPQGGIFCTETTQVTRQMAESQLSHLARIHGRFYGKLDATPVLAGWPNGVEQFHRIERWLKNDFGAIAMKGFVDAEALIPPRLFARRDEVWPATRRAFALHGTCEQTYTHNDPHLRNWYVAPSGEMRVSDWQVSVRGDWGFDIAYCITTSLTVGDRRAWLPDLLQLYAEKLQEFGGPVISFDEALNSYRRHLFAALAWWTPCVKSEFVYHPQEAVLEIVDRIATAIDDCDALDSFD